MTTPRILKPGLLTPPPPLESAIRVLGHLKLILGHILPAGVARATAWFSALSLPTAPAVKARDEAPYVWSLNGRVSLSSFSITSPQSKTGASLISTVFPIHRTPAQRRPDRKHFVPPDKHSDPTKRKSRSRPSASIRHDRVSQR